MADLFLKQNGYIVGLHFATKIMVRHVVVGLNLDGEALARDLETNAEVFEQSGTGDATAEAASKIAADIMREIAEEARNAEADRVSAGKIRWIDP